MTPDRWFPVRPHPAAKMRLYCFPYAGGGAQAFHRWQRRMPGSVACVPALLPGREARLAEPPVAELEPLVGALTDAIVAVIEPPYALYGHSMGAIVAFELARSLRRLDVEPPLGLIVSARPAPHVAPAQPALHTLPDFDLLAELKRLGGLPDAIAASPELSQLFLPLLRADLAVNEAYVHRAGDPLDVPLTALAGRSDPRVRIPDVSAWRDHTADAFELEVMEGGHFFPFEDPAPPIELVTGRLAGWSRATLLR